MSPSIYAALALLGVWVVVTVGAMNATASHQWRESTGIDSIVDGSATDRRSSAERESTPNASTDDATDGVDPVADD